MVGRSPVLLHSTRPIEAAEEEFRASLEVDTRVPRGGVVLWNKAAARGPFAAAIRSRDVAAVGGAESPADLAVKRAPHR